jgi:hypothetical protein
MKITSKHMLVGLLATLMCLALTQVSTLAQSSESIFFDFDGECKSSFGNGCSTFGLSEGDKVSGTFTFDKDLVIPGAQVKPIGPSTLGMDFSLTFGNVVYTKSDLQDLSFTVVEFSTPDASSLVGFGTQMRPVEYAVGLVDPYSLVVFGGDPKSRVYVREKGTAVFINGAFAEAVWTRRHTPVSIDIKPSNERNVINPRAKGSIWVAVLSDTEPESPFDPSSLVDIPTVALGPDGAKATRYIVKDINKDGLGDLLLRFKMPQTGISCGDIEAKLTGETFGGQSFSGKDSIKTVGCEKAKKTKMKTQ